MTVLSRVLIRKMIIQEMRLSAPRKQFKPKLTSGLSFGDDDKTLDIDNDTEIDEIPSFMGGFEDTEIDFDSDVDDFGFDDDMDDDFEFESETEEDPDPESETEYNPGRQVMDMSGAEIRRHVMSAAEKLSPDMMSRNRRSRAEMRYDDLARQGRESEMPDPEFEDTLDLAPREIREHINKRIQQLIRRQIRLL